MASLDSLFPSATPLKLGENVLDGRAFLAPMSGITDAPFRRLAQRFGASLVVSEMTASPSLVRGDKDALRRLAGKDTFKPFVVQLAGCEARWMELGARVAVDRGADVIDINMGCPARQVTGLLSGSALMRNPDHALRLIEAVVKASARPVTLKMRLGWDKHSLNAPCLARHAENAGVQMISVHGRTRQQFYKGKADWSAVRQVKQAVTIPVVVNGDIASFDQMVMALEHSRSDAVMIGRGAQGRPWFVGEMAARLAGKPSKPFPPEKRYEVMTEHYEAMLSHYGLERGRRCARKHLGWYVEREVQSFTMEHRRSLKARLCRLERPQDVRAMVWRLFHDPASLV